MNSSEKNDRLAAVLREDSQEPKLSSNDHFLGQFPMIKTGSQFTHTQISYMIK